MMGISLSTMAPISPESALALLPQPYLVTGDPHPHLRAPPVPDDFNCHKYTPQTGWVKIDCKPKSEVDLLSPPT